MRPLLPRPKSGLKEYLTSPACPAHPHPHPTGHRAGGGASPAFSVSQVELGTAQTGAGGREEGGGLPSLGVELLGGKWRSEWLPGRQEVALREF